MPKAENSGKKMDQWALLPGMITPNHLVQLKVNPGTYAKAMADAMQACCEKGYLIFLADKLYFCETSPSGEYTLQLTLWYHRMVPKPFFFDNNCGGYNFGCQTSSILSALKNINKTDTAIFELFNNSNAIKITVTKGGPNSTVAQNIAYYSHILIERITMEPPVFTRRDENPNVRTTLEGFIAQVKRVCEMKCNYIHVKAFDSYILLEIDTGAVGEKPIIPLGDIPSAPMPRVYQESPIVKMVPNGSGAELVPSGGSIGMMPLLVLPTAPDAPICQFKINYKEFSKLQKFSGISEKTSIVKIICEPEKPMKFIFDVGLIGYAVAFIYPTRR